MLKILFINSKKAQCSIWNSGVMVYNALKLSDKYQIDYVEVDQNDRTIPAEYDVFVFNYHQVTMSWLDTGCIRKLGGLSVTVVLEIFPNDPFPMCPRTAFDAYLVLDPTINIKNKRVFPFPRPLEMFDPSKPYVETPVPVIGTFGFATVGKGFDQVVDAVNKEFDRAIVRINIPYGTYVPDSDLCAKKMADECVARAKKGVEVRVTHDYMTKQQLVDWCASNTLNCFLYNRTQPGLAATTDQAVLAMRPLAVSQDVTFRHVTQYVRPYPEWSLRDSIEKSMDGVLKMKADWTPRMFAARFEEVLSKFKVVESTQFRRKKFMLRWTLRLIVTTFIRKVLQRLAARKQESVHYLPSYSQAGEDLIVGALFRSFGLSKFSYLDVGANHPDFISNTYLFYKAGSRGVCVEPNPELYKKHRAVRPDDVCLNVGVGFDGRKEADFYLFPSHADGLSTFSKNDADFWENVGLERIGKFKPEKVISMPLKSINEIIAGSVVPDFLSIDVEGLDLKVLQTLDFEKYQIKCICVETVKYGEGNKEYRDVELMRFLKEKNYFIYADTGINTIYVNTKWFQLCQQRLEGTEKSVK